MGDPNKATAGESGSASLSQQESFAAIAVAAVLADGQVRPVEADRVAYDLATIRHFEGCNIRDLVAILDRVTALIKLKGRDSILQAAKAALSQEQLGSAFFLAADLVLADGRLGQREKDFLEELRLTLDIDNDTAIKIVEVAVTKNKA